VGSIKNIRRGVSFLVDRVKSIFCCKVESKKQTLLSRGFLKHTLKFSTKQETNPKVCTYTHSRKKSAVLLNHLSLFTSLMFLTNKKKKKPQPSIPRVHNAFQ